MSPGPALPCSAAAVAGEQPLHETRPGCTCWLPTTNNIPLEQVLCECSRQLFVLLPGIPRRAER